MTSELFKDLAKTIAQHGSKESVGDDRIVSMSELSLILSEAKGKLQPLAVIFPLFGVEFILLSDGTVSLSNEEEEGSYLDLQDEATIERVVSYLTWRAETIRSVNL